MKNILDRGKIFTVLSFLPLAVFLRVASYYGHTERAWALAFYSGAAAVSCVMLFLRTRRMPSRDLLMAFVLLFFSGSLAFLMEFRPMLDLYGRFKGSVFLACYLLVRAIFYFFPRTLSGFAYDPYPRSPGLAAGLLTGAFVWSLFNSNVIVSTVAPVTLILLLLSPLERGPAGEGHG